MATLGRLVARLFASRPRPLAAQLPPPCPDFIEPEESVVVIGYWGEVDGAPVNTMATKSATVVGFSGGAGLTMAELLDMTPPG